MNFFAHKANIWLGRVTHKENIGNPGLRCYTITQVRMYKSLAEDAWTWFVEVNPTFDCSGLT